MNTGFRGTYVISWSQTNVEGFQGAPLTALTVGATWGWTGQPTRVDGPSEVLRLEGAQGEDELRKRAARRVSTLVGAAIEHRDASSLEDIEPPALPDSSFIVTDGRQSYTVTLIPTGTGKPPLVMFVDALPPANADLWVVHEAVDHGPRDTAAEMGAGVICFTPGTMIDTPDGPRLVEELGEGDRVLTKDNGPQEILWRGSRRMSGARLFAMPRLRPVRIHANAFGSDLPPSSFLVSPDHKLIVRGDVARDLFNTTEVLVSAKHLVNNETVAVDYNAREVTYVHLLLERHEVLWANGIETESFHPGNTSLATLTNDDRARLLGGLPDLERDPMSYGETARRILTESEAALLTHVA